MAITPARISADGAHRWPSIGERQMFGRTRPADQGTLLAKDAGEDKIRGDIDAIFTAAARGTNHAARRFETHAIE